MAKSKHQDVRKTRFTLKNRLLMEALIDVHSVTGVPKISDEMEALINDPNSAGALKAAREKYGELFTHLFGEDVGLKDGVKHRDVTAKVESEMIGALRVMFGVTPSANGDFDVDATSFATTLLQLINVQKIRSPDADKAMVMYSNVEHSYVPAAGKLNELITVIIVKLLHLSWLSNVESDVLAIIDRLAPEYDFSSDNRYSSFINGDYDWEKRELVEHDPSHMTLYTHPVVIAPGKHPILDSMFASRWPGDPVVGEMILEWWGWHYQRIGAPFVVIFYSPGFTGKSTLLTQMAKSMGDGVVSHAAITQLTGEFGLSKLLTRNNADLVLGDFNDEIDAKTAWPVQIVKQLSSPGSTLNIARKNKEAVNLQSRTLLTQAMNSKPSVAFGSLENTVGYKRRLVPIDWGQPLSADEADDKFSEKLEQELGAIVWDAIEMFNCLKDRGLGTFVRSETVKATREIWFGEEKATTPVEEFVEKFVDRDNGKKTARSVFFNAYVEWLKETDKYSAKYVNNQRFWPEFEHAAGEKLGMTIEHGNIHNHLTAEFDIVLTKEEG